MSLDRALKLHGAGDLYAAEREYRRVLAGDPLCHEALHGLGLVLHQDGRHHPAATLLNQALELCPQQADYHYHLGEVLRAEGRYADAIRAYREAIRLNDADADYHFGLANALAEQGSSTESIAAYERAACLAPKDAEIHNNLGNALASIGVIDAAEAHLRQAVSLSPDYADAHHNLALVLNESGSLVEALAHARRACESAPDRAEPLLNLGRLLDAAGDPSGAVTCCRKAVERSPDNPALLAMIAEALRNAGDSRLASSVYRTVVGLEPASAGHRAALCHCLIQLHCFSEAEAESRRALGIDPHCAAAMGALAVCLQVRGCFDRAAELLRRALTLQPALTEAAYLLAASGADEVSDRELAHWVELLDDDGLPREKQCHLHFAVAKVREHRRQYDTAFEHFQKANGIKARLYPFDRRRHTNYVNRIMAVFTPAFFERRREHGMADERPVFIVGMPRSGSTLVEQVLAGHRDAAGIGEHPEMREIMRDLPATLDARQPVPEACRTLTRDMSVELATRYLASVPEAAAGGTRIFDKMLGNFLRLGVIALLFPRARVVHCVRNPLDTCASCFTQDFAQGLRFTTDLVDLASFYRDYRALMAHWRRVLPLPILDVDYESLVREPERTISDLLAFCDLPWDEQCLSPHLRRREVATASVRQARQPIYTSSIRRWRRYEAHLGPLIEALRETGICDAG